MPHLSSMNKGELLVQLGKPQVVADRDAEAPHRRVARHDLISRESLKPTAGSHQQHLNGSDRVCSCGSVLLCDTDLFAFDKPNHGHVV